MTIWFNTEGWVLKKDGVSMCYLAVPSKGNLCWEWKKKYNYRFACNAKINSCYDKMVFGGKTRHKVIYPKGYKNTNEPDMALCFLANWESKHKQYWKFLQFCYFWGWLQGEHQKSQKIVTFENRLMSEINCRCQPE